MFGVFSRTSRLGDLLGIIKEETMPGEDVERQDVQKREGEEKKRKPKKTPCASL